MSMPKHNQVWTQSWCSMLVEQKTIEAVDFLNKQTGENRRTPSTEVKSQAIECCKNQFETKSLLDIASTLAVQPHPTGKEIAAYLLVETYEQDPIQVMEELVQLADDDDWEVREWVAGACGERLTGHFASFYPEMVKWTKKESGNVRRAAALAAKYACKTKNVDWAEPLFDLVEPLLFDRDPYVKKNLGPFTIGDAMLRAYPDETLERLEKWIDWDNVHVRWNIAKVFSTAVGAKHSEKGLHILKVLLNDNRIEVKRAVKSAMNNLKKRQPDIHECLKKEM